jgi:hypothetical protein
VVAFVGTGACRLAHFPIRSAEQFRKKAIWGWLAKLANHHNGGRRPEWSHWKRFYDRVRAGGEITAEEMRLLALGYTHDHSSEKPHMILDPVPTFDIDMRY